MREGKDAPPRTCCVCCCATTTTTKQRVDRCRGRGLRGRRFRQVFFFAIRRRGVACCTVQRCHLLGLQQLLTTWSVGRRLLTPASSGRCRRSTAQRAARHDTPTSSSSNYTESRRSRCFVLEREGTNGGDRVASGTVGVATACFNGRRRLGWGVCLQGAHGLPGVRLS